MTIWNLIVELLKKAAHTAKDIQLAHFYCIETQLKLTILLNHYSSGEVMNGLVKKSDVLFLV